MNFELKGKWEGDWDADRTKFIGRYTFPDGRYFEGEAWWRSSVERTHIGPTGHLMEAISHPVKPHWEFTGSWFRADGQGASAPHEPEPPEQRDDGTPPPEQEAL